jgi:hypothetical protein
VEFIRQWKVGDKTFASKRAALKFEAEEALSAVLADYSVDEMMSRADHVIALLKPFATPKTRKPKGNGTEAKPSKATKAQPASAAA